MLAFKFPAHKGNEGDSRIQLSALQPIITNLKSSELI